MDKEVVRSALGGIDTILSKAKRALREVEYEAFSGGDDLGRYDNPVDAMAFHLGQLYEHLLVILEAAQMQETRANLIIRWDAFKKLHDGLRHTKRFEDYDSLISPALEFIEQIVSGLQMTVSGETTSEEAWTLARLEEMLQDTSALVHRRPKAPAKEHELQKIMHDYLSACFPSDFSRKPQIDGSIKNFHPDCGIRSIGAAIEFKLAHTKEEAVIAFNGVVEDTAGYKGSKTWTRFFAVIYQAKPFLSNSQFKSDMKRVGADTWKAILVNGKTAPKSKSKKPALPATTPKKTGKRK